MKNFVLDTNVILHDPHCIFEFEDNKVVIILPVLEELDSFKSASGQLGHSARQAIRYLEEIRIKGSLQKGVELENGGQVQVITYLPHQEIPNDKTTDNKLLTTTKSLCRVEPSILITKDINLRIKADALGIDTEDYEKGKVDGDHYKGHRLLELPGSYVGDLLKHKCVKTKYVGEEALINNEFLRFIEEDGKNSSFIGMHRNGEIIRVDSKPRALGITARNLEQTYALNALLDDDISLVTLQAKAGAGKTLLAMAAALQKTVKEHKYEKIVVCRPIVPIGEGLGFLPGDVDEKMAPWMKPIFDNIGVISKTGKGNERLADLVHNPDLLEIAPLSYIRGRSISQAFIIIDEAQNLSPLEIKTIVTRVGEGSKIVFTGDISQIDKITLDKYSCGFSHLINNFKNQQIYAHLELEKSERSPLAELGADLL